MGNPVKYEDVEHFMQMVGLPCVENAFEKDTMEQYGMYDLATVGLGIGYPGNNVNVTSFKDNDKSTLTNVFRRVMICLADYHKRLEERDETIQKLSRDLSDARASENRLRDNLERVEKEIKAITEKERFATARLRDTEAAYMKEKNEVIRLTRKAADLTSHGNAIASRREFDLEQKCDKLKSMLRDNRPNNPAGIKMVNVLPRRDGSRGVWNTDAMTQKRKTDLMSSAKTSLVERNAHFCNENVLLKRTLEAILQEIVSISDVQTTRQMCDGEYQNESFAQLVRVTLYSQQYFDGDNQKKILSIFRDKLEEAKEILQLPIHEEFAQMLQLDLPVHEVSAPMLQLDLPVHQELAPMLQLDLPVHEKSAPILQLDLPVHKEPAPMLQLDDSEKIRLVKEVASLKEELELREQVIQHHEILLDAAVQVDNLDNPHLKHGFVLEEQEKFQRERNFFLEQRSNFERERRAFTEAAMRLARDRKEFDEQRYNIMKLHSIPFETPTRKPKMALQLENELPTTPELYQVLGLPTVE